MSDLISTQEAVAKIVDTAMRNILSGEQKLTKEYEQTVIDAVNVILNTSQHEIVRCKDCKYYVNIRRTNRFWCNTDDGIGVENPEPDDYCSRAERRPNEHID